MSSHIRSERPAQSPQSSQPLISTRSSTFATFSQSPLSSQLPTIAPPQSGYLYDKWNSDDCEDQVDLLRRSHEACNCDDDDLNAELENAEATFGSRRGIKFVNQVDFMIRSLLAPSSNRNVNNNSDLIDHNNTNGNTNGNMNMDVDKVETTSYRRTDHANGRDGSSFGHYHRHPDQMGAQSNDNGRASSFDVGSDMKDARPQAQA